MPREVIMKFNRIVRGMIAGMGFVASLVLVGCAVEAGDDVDREGSTGAAVHIGEAAEAIGTECAAASPITTFVGGFDYTSPQTYNTANCYKAVALDVTNYQTGVAPPLCGYPDFRTSVHWVDAPPSTPAACSQAWLRADLFEIVNGVPV